MLEKILGVYGANIKVLDFWIGSSVTTYDFHLPSGFRLESLIRIEKDIARDLQCQSIRILPSMKQSANIGIEIENPKRFSIQLPAVD